MQRRFLLFALSFIVVLFTAWFWPLPSALIQPSAVTTTKILDREGRTLYDQRNGGLREYVRLPDIPEDIIQALVTMEDRTFWTNPGVSLRGIARAAVRDFYAAKFVEGGSTITQQFVRLRLQPEHRGVFYKIREAWLAVKISRSLSKQDILERFLNDAYFGNQAYGVAAASRIFFGKNLSELSGAESALLVGLLNAPTALNPYKNSKATMQRRNLVLHVLHSQGLITDEQLQIDLMEPIHLASGQVKISAPHFVFWQIQERGIEWKEKTEVRTTIDLSLQKEVEMIISNQLEKLKDLRVTSAAVVVLDVKTGDILSMVGSADYFDTEHDGAVNVALANRQPGSALKPFTYALGLSKGMTAATTITDVETPFFTQEGNIYTPRNYDFDYHGLVRLREALANSYNIPAIKVAEKVGVSTLISFLQKIGISTINKSPDHYGLALTLGDAEVKLLELTKAFAMFAHGGKTVAVRTMLDDPIHTGEQVIDPKIAWLITDILSDNDARAAEFGRASSLSFYFPVAAKTGTTRNSRDNWVVGYTPSRVVGVWVGNADNTPMKGTSGITGAGPIFHDVMIAATHGVPSEQFQRPPGIVDVEICRLSGKKVTPLCPTSLTEHFIAGTEPNEDDMFREITIDTRNGQLATADCDEKFLQKKVFAFLPAEVQEWARNNGWKMPPTKTSPFCTSQVSHPIQPMVETSDALTISSPYTGTTFLLDPLIPDSYEQIFFRAHTESEIQSVEWHVNGEKVGEGSAPDFSLAWPLRPGTFLIEAIANDQKDAVTIDVQQNR